MPNINKYAFSSFKIIKEKKTIHRARASRHNSLIGETDAGDDLTARLRHALAHEQSFIVIVIADAQRVVREAPRHVLVVCGRH